MNVLCGRASSRRASYQCQVVCRTRRKYTRRLARLTLLDYKLPLRPKLTVRHTVYQVLCSFTTPLLSEVQNRMLGRSDEPCALLGEQSQKAVNRGSRANLRVYVRRTQRHTIRNLIEPGDRRSSDGTKWMGRNPPSPWI